MAVKPTAELLDLLNQAVARELQVSIQYMLQHSKMEKILQRVMPENVLLEKTTYDTIGDILKDFAIQEMKHAADIMERIYYLGGEATTKGTMPTIGDNLSEFAQLGLQAEEEALALYRKIIITAGELRDWETRELFEKIYHDEEEHFFRFQEFTEIEPPPDLPKAPDVEWMSTITDDYIALLNKAVAAEISAIIQYTTQHEKAAKLALRKKSKAMEVKQDHTKAEVVSNILKKIFMQEMEHLEQIAERIYLLDGECVVVPDPLPEVRDTPDEWLLDNRKAEDYAIVLYREIIAEAGKQGDYPTRALFEKIIIDEDEHFFIFDDFFSA
ncbi:MAG: bacterioferritin [Candidatus Thorarchaeota archaeon]